MFSKINKMIDFNKKILDLYAKRQEILSSNIANADTPNYKSKDINFKDEMNKIIKKNYLHISLKKTSSHHLSAKKNNLSIVELYSIHDAKKQLNGNTVNMNHERVKFIKNMLKYEENIVFIKNEIKNLMHVLKG